VGLKLRRYGEAGPSLILVHGGPGAPGTLAPVGRELAMDFRVLEPWQRPSGGEALTVARHVDDLQALLLRECPGERPALLGSSWGAMLVLAHAAAYPDSAGPLVLVGCGSFDPRSRARLKEIIAERLGEPMESLQARLASEFTNPDARLAAMAAALEVVYQVDPLPGEDEMGPVDAQGHEETWADMLRLQAEGVYPAAFAKIPSPVLMLHGAFDPHPGAMIRDSLLPLLPRLEYHEWEHCGHDPWRERSVRAEFFAVVRSWLLPPASEGGLSPERL
jgi:pimeloyl-ACP methyl ester carboxylesterase